MALHTGGDLAALDVFGDFLEIGEAAVGAGAEEGDVDLDAFDGLAGGQLHVGEGLDDAGAVVVGGGGLGAGDVLGDRDALAGRCPR
jgi:hypothetical protein